MDRLNWDRLITAGDTSQYPSQAPSLDEILPTEPRTIPPEVIGEPTNPALDFWMDRGDQTLQEAADALEARQVGGEESLRADVDEGFDEILNEQDTKEDKVISNMTGSQSIDFINRFCSKLNIGRQIMDICIYVCNKSEEYSLVSENTPPSIAAGSIFLVCSLLRIDIVKKQISDVCKISEVTISKCYKKLLKHHEHILPEEIIKQLYK